MLATFPSRNASTKLLALHLTTINKREGSSRDKFIDYDLKGSKPNVFPRNSTITL